MKKCTGSGRERWKTLRTVTWNAFKRIAYIWKLITPPEVRAIKSRKQELRATCCCFPMRKKLYCFLKRNIFLSYKKYKRNAKQWGKPHNRYTLQWVSESHSVMFNSLQTHGLQPARLPCPWNSLGKNTGVGCYLLLCRLSGILTILVYINIDYTHIHISFFLMVVAYYIIWISIKLMQ